ncbi:MAG TPA: M48 family metallopeptidase [Candidatus Angelobacter sp.]|nr:M48 family metallopeptidase [Candidatus Angelobacter sp.]
MVRRFSAWFWVLALAGSLSIAQSYSQTSNPQPSSDKPSGTQAPDTQAPDAQTPETQVPETQAPAAKSADAKGGEKDDDPEFHKHTGINDVNAIGSRNVGCSRGFLNWYSLDSQVNMGRQFSQQIDATSKLITDPQVTEYVNRIGQNLVRSSDSKLPFVIKVLDDETPNAFTLPGGYMYVNTGAILTADDEAELAGVMAHEIGHVAACHIARQNTRGTLAQLAMIPVMIIGGPLVNLGVNEIANLALPATFMKFSRTFEAQADYLGIQYAYKSGYDPVGMINFFEKIEALDKKKKGFITKAYESHPQTPDRVEKSQHEIASILPPRDQYIVDTSEFQNVKKRLSAIINHHKLDDGKDTGRPDLRRTAGNAPDGGKDKNDDDRPAIKRHPAPENN